MYTPLSPADSLWSRIAIDEPLACWKWKGYVNKVSGYGMTGGRRHDAYAHRAVYEFMFGKIANGMQLDHLCGVRSCVNPWHLEQVTPAENIGRVFRDKLCPRGHVRVPKTKTFPNYKFCKECANARRRVGAR